MATASKARKRSKAPTPTPLTTAQEERIEEVSVESLVFQSVKKGLSTGVGAAVTDGTLEETMQGASGLKLELLDRDYEAMESGLFGTRVFCALDGTVFRFTKLSLIDDWKLSVQFEHRLIAEMREHTGPLKAQRGKLTRAEFILAMLRELKLPFRFICPELHRKQQAPAPEQVRETHTVHHHTSQTATPNLGDAGKGPGLSSNAGLTVKHAAASSAQLEILAKALEGAAATGASALSMQALVVSLIQENSVGWNNPGFSDGRGRGPLSIIDSTARGIQGKGGAGTLINVFDVKEIAEHFCTAGFAGAGGSNALARSKPTDSPTHIATLVEAPEKEYPHSWEDEARKIVDAFRNNAGSGGSAPSFTGEGSSQSQTATTIRTATYEFTRGKPGQIEDTFICATRLAEEVGWRFFLSGQRDIYFVNDDDLLKAAPRYTIKPDSPGFVKLTFDVEVGARTIIIQGKRQPKPSEATLIVRLSRWKAPPGCVIELNGFGPADHKWLVDSVERRLHDAETTIHLRAPQHPLEEPKAVMTPSEGSQSRATKAAEGATVGGGTAGIPRAESGHYRSPPSQGPSGVVTPSASWNPSGKPVARWIVPMLEYAAAHGWRGAITSGYRPGTDPHTQTGTSEHQGTQYPHGAIDFGGYQPNPNPVREDFFRACSGYTGLAVIPAQFAGDGGHASGTGH